jgi:hypothetical protein
MIAVIKQVNLKLKMELAETLNELMAADKKIAKQERQIKKLQKKLKMK